MHNAHGRKKERKRKVSVNDGPLCLQPPPWVAQASRLDQNQLHGSSGIGLNLAGVLTVFLGEPTHQPWGESFCRWGESFCRVQKQNLAFGPIFSQYCEIVIFLIL